MKIFKYITAVVCCGTLVFAQSKVGSTAANFLSIPVGPRATAMGGSFTAIANDASAAYWNPGGLSRIRRNEFMASSTEWLVDTKINYFAVAFKVNDENGIAISINQLNYGDDEITTAEKPGGTGERWTAQDLAVGVSYARNLTDRFSIGASAKYITQTIWHETSNAFALDVGLLFETQLKGLRLGMNITNFGTEMKMEGKDLLQAADIDQTNAGNNPNIASNLDTDSWPLPLTFTVGLAYDAVATESWTVTVATDAIIPNNYETYTNCGAEILWNNMVALRCGYNGYNYVFNKPAKTAASFEEGLTAGFGLEYDFGGFFAKIDYSYTDFGIFSNISKYSISIGL